MTWDWTFVRSFLPQLALGGVVTIEATIVGSVLAMIVGLVFAIARRSRWKVIAVPVNFIVLFLRGTPLLVQLYFIFYVLPDFDIVLPAFTAGVIGLGLHYACYTSEVYRAGIESVAQGQWDAARACNFGPIQTWVRIVLPQAVPPMIPVMGNYVVAMFKESTMLSAITVVELMSQAQAIGNDTYRYTEPFTIVGLIFLSISLVSGSLLRRLERRFPSRRWSN
jgi:polar amino acid transport system permease protein